MPDLNNHAGLVSFVSFVSFPILGLLGAAACGPAGSPAGETDATSTGTEDATTDSPTNPSDPTRPTTTEPTTTEPPIPECELDSQCYISAYCNQCYQGSCRMNPVCSEEPYDYDYDDCDTYRDCPENYTCSRGECVEVPPFVLPICPPPAMDVSQWNLSNAPSAFVLADLDGDLDLDLAAAEPASGSIEIALNDGAGNFLLAGAYALAPEATGDLALAAGDLDKDGDLDLVVTRREVQGTLNLLFNDGAVFTVAVAPQFLATLPEQVFVADLNGDGALDVMTINDSAASVTVQMGDGTGKLASKQAGIMPTITGPAVLTDLSIDGVADLLAPIADNEAALWIGGPKPLLTPLQTFPVPAADVAALAADLDLDNLPDLVFVQADRAAGLAEVWSGTASKAWAFEPSRYPTSLPLTGGLLAELDPKPGPDLVAATGLARLTVLLGTGSGGFACEHIADIAGTSAPGLLAVGDVDGDGLPDIVAGGLGGPTIEILHLAF
ncbi:MAG: VCBS repeat-containing protein [Nannocystis sp.]|nr:VCBS repeat-containing protein [Nannocystis sp.]MBA3545433.1 VCBS repeat-containing protein [Nannocystis sp.]